MESICRNLGAGTTLLIAVDDCDEELARFVNYYVEVSRASAELDRSERIAIAMKLSRLLKLSKELREPRASADESPRYQRTHEEFIRLLSLVVKLLGKSAVLNLIKEARVSTVLDETAVLSLLPACPQERISILRLSRLINCEELKRGGLLEALRHIIQWRSAFVMVPIYLKGYLPSYIAERAIFFEC